MAKKNWYKELLKISLCINIIMTLFLILDLEVLFSTSIFKLGLPITIFH